MTAIAVLLRDATRQLAAAGIEAAPREARLLLQAAAGLAMAGQIADPERVIDSAAGERFRVLLARRVAREPMAQILGHREFWSLAFRVTADTLDPRPDSETLVQAALDRIKDRAAPLRLLDFGTGTGCLLLALLHELPQATGLGIDLSPAALAVAQGNAGSLGLGGRAEFRLGDWDEGVAPGFDVLVSNPPYIVSSEIAGLQPEVSRFEPRGALDGGPDGLAAYRRLLPAAARLLRPAGLAAFEIGLGQAESVVGLGRAAGLRHLATELDLGSVARVVVFEKE